MIIEVVQGGAYERERTGESIGAQIRSVVFEKSDFEANATKHYFGSGGPKRARPNTNIKSSRAMF